MIWTRKRASPRRLTAEQIRHRLSEVGGADGTGAVIQLAAHDKPSRARFVRVASRGRFHLGLNGVLAFGLFDRLWLRNVAHNRSANQSSTYRNSVAGRATTSHLNGDSMAMTRSGGPQWWQVDLERVWNLSHIVLYNGVSLNSHLTYSFDVQISRDGVEWDTVYRNGDVNSDIWRIRRRAEEVLQRALHLAQAKVVGQTASHDPAVPFDHDKSLAAIADYARELVLILGSLHNDAGDPKLAPDMADRMEILRERMVAEWQGLWPRGLDFPSATFDQLTIQPAGGLPTHACFVWPPHGTPEIFTADGRAIPAIRFGEALEAGLPEATYHALRDQYHCQDTLRFNDHWWWWYVDLSDFSDADALVVRNESRHRSYGEPWQFWGSDDLVSWSPVYDHGAVLDIFHDLLRIVWRFTWRTINELGLLMASMTLQRRNHAGWLISRGYVIDQEPTADELADFHIFLEEVNAAASLRLPVLMTKHSFQPALKHRNKAAYTEAMVSITDELERAFSIESAVWFGSLLGLIRAGDYIDHDDDVDMMYFSKATNLEGVLAERERLIAHFDALDGFRTFTRDWPGKNFHAVVEGAPGEPAYSVDMFPAWYEDGELQMWHDRLRIFRDFDPDLIFPLKEVHHAGHSLLGPKEPEKILKDLYGPDWRTPLRSYYHTIQIDERSGSGG